MDVSKGVVRLELWVALKPDDSKERYSVEFFFSWLGPERDHWITHTETPPPFGAPPRIGGSSGRRLSQLGALSVEVELVSTRYTSSSTDS